MATNYTDRCLDSSWQGAWVSGKTIPFLICQYCIKGNSNMVVTIFEVRGQLNQFCQSAHIWPPSNRHSQRRWVLNQGSLLCPLENFICPPRLSALRPNQLNRADQYMGVLHAGKSDCLNTLISFLQAVNCVYIVRDKGSDVGKKTSHRFIGIRWLFWFMKNLVTPVWGFHTIVVCCFSCSRLSIGVFRVW